MDRKRREPDTLSFPNSEVLSATRTDLIISVGGIGEKKIPKHYISDDSEVWREGDTGILVVPEWYALEYEWFGPEDETQD